jgi:hypothetical protein
MNLSELRLNRLGLIVDMVGLWGLLVAWILGTWGVAVFLILAAAKGDLSWLAAAIACGVLGLIIWWFSVGIVRRGRLRTCLSGLGALALAAMVLLGHALAPEASSGSSLNVVASVVLFAAMGLILVVATFARPQD